MSSNNNKQQVKQQQQQQQQPKRTSPQQPNVTSTQFDDSKQPHYDRTTGVMPDVNKQQDIKSRQLHEQQIKTQDITKPIQQQPQTKQQQQQQQKRTSPQQNITKDQIQTAIHEKEKHVDESLPRRHITHFKRLSRERIRSTPHTGHNWSFLSNNKNSLNPLPKSLVQFLDHHNLAAMNTPSQANKSLTTFARYLSGCVLGRDPNTKHFKWFVPSLTMPNARFYRDINLVSNFKCNDDDTGTTTTATKTKCTPKQLESIEKRCKQIWKDQVCDEIRSITRSRFLHRVLPTKNELILTTLQHEYFKLLRIVCDSYVMFNSLKTCGNNKTCDATQLPMALDRSFCNIAAVVPKQQRKTATTTAAANKPRQQTKCCKPWVLKQDVITNSIYDEVAMANLCTRTTYPTPLSLTLHKDYRAPRVDWNRNTVLTLQRSIATVLKNSLLHQLSKLQTTRLGRRMQLRDHCILRINDLCPEADNYLAECYENRCNNNNNNNNTATNTCKNPQKRLEWCNKIDAWLNDNTNNLFTINRNQTKYNALSSLRPIDIWSLRTYIRQQRLQLDPKCQQQSTTITNNNNNQACPNPYDIRCNKAQFAKDIADGSKRTAYTFQRSALRDYNTACQYHTKTCDRLTCCDLKKAHLLLTSTPWSMFFTNRNFQPALQRAKSALQPLPQYWVDIQQFMCDSRAFLTSQLIKLNRMGMNRGKSQQTTTTKKQDNKTTDNNNNCGYKIDQKHRKCSTWVTPQLLSQAKRNLRRVFNDRTSVTNWFNYLSLNPYLGTTEHNRTQNKAEDANIIDTFLGFLSRKLSQ